MEALHDHLKGELAGAAVTLGGALDGQAGYAGVCADGEGVFLKAALLYLSGEEVCVRVFCGIYTYGGLSVKRGGTAWSGGRDQSMASPPRNFLTCAHDLCRPFLAPEAFSVAVS